MKNMKKIASVLLAVILVLAMSVPAFAAGTGTITIDNAIDGETYTIYKMLDFKAAGGVDENGKPTGIYTVAAGWEAFFAEGGAGAAYFNVSTADGTVTIKDDKKTDADLVDLAKAAIAFGATKTDSKDANGTTVVFENLDLGYYAIDTSLGTVCALTNTNSDFTATEKNEVPTIDKFVKEDSNGEWQKWNDADIGQVVEYKSTITVKKGAVGYTMHDKMEAGLTFDPASVKVFVNDAEVTSGFTVNADPEDGCTFCVDFTDEYISSLAPETEIVVMYSATLNKDAEIATETNDNEVWLEYGEKNTVTEHHKTETLTYYFNLDKVEKGSNKRLEGAEFELLINGTPIAFVLEEDGYRKATADDADTTTTIVVGEAKIYGLDADTYSLKETKAPAGYNLLDKEIEVKINAATVGENIEFEPVSKTVENSTGSLLPETGGMGTTMFYMLGGLLVVGAAILLVSKKRMAYEA